MSDKLIQELTRLNDNIDTAETLISQIKPKLTGNYINAKLRMLTEDLHTPICVIPSYDNRMWHQGHISEYEIMDDDKGIFSIRISGNGRTLVLYYYDNSTNTSTTLNGKHHETLSIFSNIKFVAYNKDSGYIYILTVFSNAHHMVLFKKNSSFNALVSLNSLNVGNVINAVPDFDNDKIYILTSKYINSDDIEFKIYVYSTITDSIDMGTVIDSNIVPKFENMSSNIIRLVSKNEFTYLSSDFTIGVKNIHTGTSAPILLSTRNMINLNGPQDNNEVNHLYFTIMSDLFENNGNKNRTSVTIIDYYQMLCILTVVPDLGNSVYLSLGPYYIYLGRFYDARYEGTQRKDSTSLYTKSDGTIVANVRRILGEESQYTTNSTGRDLLKFNIYTAMTFKGDKIWQM
jgi:hypothetical protein